MTIYTTLTPKTGGKRKSVIAHQIESRVVGVEVYAGPIQETLLYYTDDLVGHGANIMIEIQRQGID